MLFDNSFFFFDLLLDTNLNCEPLNLLLFKFFSYLYFLTSDHSLSLIYLVDKKCLRCFWKMFISCLVCFKHLCLSVRPNVALFRHRHLAADSAASLVWRQPLCASPLWNQPLHNGPHKNFLQLKLKVNSAVADQAICCCGSVIYPAVI